MVLGLSDRQVTKGRHFPTGSCISVCIIKDLQFLSSWQPSSCLVCSFLSPGFYYRTHGLLVGSLAFIRVTGSTQGYLEWELRSRSGLWSVH